MPRTAKRVLSPPDRNAQAMTPLLTARQAMTMLGVGRTSLWCLMREGGLPYIKLGRGRKAALRFSVESLNLWLKQQERHTPMN
ncbi:MAG TPA: helix-turn-helix domain-containing protein [Ktedonobacteraceae bacterium]|nr:helix-turn-helix domain-containing protein [Ktedonobacteraceae bacterium]